MIPVIPFTSLSGIYRIVLQNVEIVQEMKVVKTKKTVLLLLDPLGIFPLILLGIRLTEDFRRQGCNINGKFTHSNEESKNKNIERGLGSGGARL